VFVNSVTVRNSWENTSRCLEFLLVYLHCVSSYLVCTYRSDKEWAHGTPMSSTLTFWSQTAQNLLQGSTLIPTQGKTESFLLLRSTTTASQIQLKSSSYLRKSVHS